MKEEEEAPCPAIANACGRLFHYLSCGGNASSSCTRTAADKAATEEERREWRNASHCSAFATSGVVSDWVRTDPDLTLAWVENRSRTTAQMSARRRRRINDQLYKIGLAKSNCTTRSLADKGKGGWRGSASRPNRRR